jgi:hypothetical protein
MKKSEAVAYVSLICQAANTTLVAQPVEAGASGEYKILCRFGPEYSLSIWLSAYADVIRFLDALSKGQPELAGGVLRPHKHQAKIKRLIQICREVETNCSDDVLALLTQRVRLDLEGTEYDGLEVSDENGSCLRIYYQIHGYEGELWDVIKGVEFCYEGELCDLIKGVE